MYSFNTLIYHSAHIIFLTEISRYCRIDPVLPYFFAPRQGLYKGYIERRNLVPGISSDTYTRRGYAYYASHAGPRACRPCTRRMPSCPSPLRNQLSFHSLEITVNTRRACRITYARSRDFPKKRKTFRDRHRR